MQPTWRALPQEVELTRISLSSRRRDLKQSHRAGTKREVVAIVQQSCSDSLAIANPMNKVFGTDRCQSVSCGAANTLSAGGTPRWANPSVLSPLPFHAHPPQFADQACEFVRLSSYYSLPTLTCQA